MRGMGWRSGQTFCILTGFWDKDKHAQLFSIVQNASKIRCFYYDEKSQYETYSIKKVDVVVFKDNWGTLSQFEVSGSKKLM